MGREITLESRYIYKGRIVNLRDDTVRLENGHVTRREIVEHRGAVGIVAIDEEGNVLLVRQYRKPVEAELLEIPAGTLSPDEEPLACAHRELEEETGYRAGRMIPLGGFYSSPGFCTEFIHIFLATALEPSTPSPEEDEGIELVKMPLRQAVRLIDKGDIRDAKTIVGLLIAARKVEQEG